MRALSTTASINFVAGYTQEQAATNIGMRDFLDHVKTTNFLEGTQQFNELRCCLLRESEQCLIMACNCYARGLDGLRAGSAFWSSVSFYYAAFFAAKAIMGTYGCWIGASNRWIEVTDGTPGSFRLTYRTSKYGNLTGSHKVTWDAYYNMVARLSSFLTSSEAVIAKSAVNNMRTWLTEERNQVNYHPQHALQAAEDFDNSFDPANVPQCFSGRIQTLLRVSQAFVLFGKESALRVGLVTDIWQPLASRSDYLDTKVTSPVHAAISHFYEKK